MTDTRFFVVNGQKMTGQIAAPGLHIVSTPIGNLKDITLRALETLAGVDVVYCEDTRISRKLLTHYGISVPTRSYHEHNAEGRRPEILELLRQSKAIALVSDAGTPVVSDPGYKLVNACLRSGYPVHAAPGVSAPITALTLSGLPSDRVLFAGFPPQKHGQRQKFLHGFTDHQTTLILFESAKRLPALLSDMRSIFGDRPVAISRELTKKFEEVIRGKTSDVIADLAAREAIKGEITIVFDLNDRNRDAISETDLKRAIGDALGASSASQAATSVAREFGLRKKDVYARILAMKDEEG